MLRALEPEDLDFLYTIENDPALWSVTDTNVPYSYYDLKDYIANQRHDIYADRQLRLVVSDSSVTRGGIAQPVGLLDLFNFSPENRRAELGLTIKKEFQGKGFAVEALREIDTYVTEKIGLHQLYCIVSVDNVASHGMLCKAGFVKTSTLEDWLLTPDGYRDCVVFVKRY